MLDPETPSRGLRRLLVGVWGVSRYTCSGIFRPERLCLTAGAPPSDRLSSIGAPICFVFSKFFLGYLPCKTVCITPSWVGFPSSIDCSTTEKDADTERYVFGKLSARCFKRRPFGHRHYSNYSNYKYCCGDIDHGRSVQAGGVIYIRCMLAGHRVSFIFFFSKNLLWG